MAQFASIISDNYSSDDIKIYMKDPYFIGFANRGDLLDLSTIDLVNQPGIYVLIGGDQRYVGQASVNITDRLSHHDRVESKDWWESVVFFGHMYGELDKSQLDYLERNLITELRSLSFIVTNVSTGNTSFIELPRQLRADDLYFTVLALLRTVGGYDLLDDSFQPVTAHKSDSPFAAKFEFQDSLGNVFSGDYASYVFFDFIRYYLCNPAYQLRLYDYLLEDGPVNRQSFLGKQPHISDNGENLSVHLCDGIYVYNRFSVNERKQKLDELASLLDIEINYIHGFI